VLYVSQTVLPETESRFWCSVVWLSPWWWWLDGQLPVEENRAESSTHIGIGIAEEQHRLLDSVI